MNTLLKAACLAVYVLALAGLAGLLPPGLSGRVLGTKTGVFDDDG